MGWALIVFVLTFVLRANAGSLLPSKCAEYRAPCAEHSVRPPRVCKSLRPVGIWAGERPPCKETLYVWLDLQTLAMDWVYEEAYEEWKRWRSAADAAPWEYPYDVWVETLASRPMSQQVLKLCAREGHNCSIHNGDSKRALIDGQCAACDREALAFQVMATESHYRWQKLCHCHAQAPCCAEFCATRCKPQWSTTKWARIALNLEQYQRSFVFGVYPEHRVLEPSWIYRYSPWETPD